MSILKTSVIIGPLRIDVFLWLFAALAILYFAKFNLSIIKLSQKFKKAE